MSTCLTCRVAALDLKIEKTADPPKPPRDAERAVQTLPAQRCPHCGGVKALVGDGDGFTTAIVDEALERAHAKRAAILKDAANPLAFDAPPGVKSMPEDGTYRPRNWEMVVDPASPEDLALVQGSLKVAATEGFGVVATVPDGKTDELASKLSADEKSHLTIVQKRPSLLWNKDDDGALGKVEKTATSQWFEDDREVGADGAFHMPARITETTAAGRRGSAVEMLRAMDASRDARGLAGSGITHSGSVAYLDAQRDAAVTALAEKRPIVEDLSYPEGGNVLRGTLANGDGYALVGKDSVSSTQWRLSKDLNRSISEDEARNALAYDLGLPPNRIVPVEQPGNFHLDMEMTPLPGGKVLVNDAREAAALQEKWLREDRPDDPGLASIIAERRADAERRAKYEDMAAKDLRDAGFDVQRMAGVFPDDEKPMNFMNTESGVGKDGGSFMVMLGGDPRAQAYVTGKLKESGVDRVYFMPQEMNANLLNKGGLSCRVKGEGAPLTPDEMEELSSRPKLTPQVFNLNCPICHAPLH